MANFVNGCPPCFLMCCTTLPALWSSSSVVAHLAFSCVVLLCQRYGQFRQWLPALLSHVLYYFASVMVNFVNGCPPCFLMCCITLPALWPTSSMVARLAFSCVVLLCQRYGHLLQWLPTLLSHVLYYFASVMANFVNGCPPCFLMCCTTLPALWSSSSVVAHLAFSCVVLLAVMPVLWSTSSVIAHLACSCVVLLDVMLASWSTSVVAYLALCSLSVCIFICFVFFVRCLWLF